MCPRARFQLHNSVGVTLSCSAVPRLFCLRFLKPEPGSGVGSSPGAELGEFTYSSAASSLGGTDPVQGAEHPALGVGSLTWPLIQALGRFKSGPGAGEMEGLV